MENIDHYGLPTLIKPRKGIDDPQLMVSSAAKQVDLFIFRIQTSALSEWTVRQTRSPLPPLHGRPNPPSPISTAVVTNQEIVEANKR